MSLFFIEGDMPRMRKRLYEIIETANGDDEASRIYDWFMMFVIIVSMIPLLMPTNEKPYIHFIDGTTAIIFVVDYILRIITADYKLEKTKHPFIKYPFTLMAVIDLVSILPSITVLNRAFRLFKIFRLLRTFRVFRVFRVIRYSKSVNMIVDVFRKQKEPLFVVCILALGYIFISALLIINIEPETFPTFFDAVYWATISLTTVGYGDIYAVSTAGRILTMISSVFGIAIVALPAGIVTAGLMTELNDKKDDEK